MVELTKPGYENAWTKAFNDYARKVGMLKDKDKNLEGSDVREGLSVVLSLRIPEEILQFEGQTKEKLGTPEARSIVDSVVSEKLGYYLMEMVSLLRRWFTKVFVPVKPVKLPEKLGIKHEAASAIRNRNVYYPVN